MGHRNKTKDFSRKISVYVMITCMIFSLHTPATLAGPEGAQVVNGQVSFQQNGLNTTITASDKAIVNYSSFDITQPEIVEFVQPSISASVLNRILSANPTTIDGTLLANGRVFFVNPAGVIIGSGARINVNQLVASALNISNSDFINGRYNFAGGSGPVINHGDISAEKVYLIGKQIANSGTISCPTGYVIMAAGDRVFIGEIGSDVVVEIDVPSLPEPVGPIEGSAVLNEGTVEVGNGTIVLAAAGDIYSQAISNVGTLSASVDSGDAGQVKLTAADGTVINSGSIKATSSSGIGGTVQVLGDKVALSDAAVIDASGSDGGGTVLVGGDYQGKGDVLTASRTYAGPDSTIKADATENGDGGKVIVWSDEATRFYGDISARGGAEGGDGGFVEVSSKEFLQFRGDVDLRADNGSGGTLLLDPRDVIIQDTSPAADDGEIADGTINFGDGTPPALDDFTISDNAIEVLGDVTVIIQAQQDLTIQTIADGLAFGATGTAGTYVSLEAGRHLTVAADVTNGVSTQGGALTLKAGVPGQTYSIDDGTLYINAPLDTTGGGASGGDITLSGGGIALAANVTAGTGAINFYTNTGERTIGIGNGSGQYGVGNPELAQIQSAGTIRFGEQGTQGEVVRVKTVTWPAAVSGASIEINSNSGTGSVTFDDGGTGTAFATGGSGNVTVRAGTGGIVNTDVTDNTYAEISTTGTITLTSAGAIGTSTNRIEFVNNQDDVVVTNAPGSVYFSGIGNLALGAIATGGGNLDVLANDDITVNGAINTGVGSVNLDSDATTINLNNSITTSGADITFNDAVLLGASVGLSTGAAVAGNINFQSTLDGAYDLALDAGTGTTTFNAAIGSTTPIGDGTGAALAISTGTTSFESTLQATSGITKAGGAGAATFKDDVTLTNGDTATNLAGSVQLDGLTFSGYDGLTFGTTTLSGGPVTLNSNGSNILFQSTLTGAQTLNLTAGTGNIDFDGVVGGITALSDVLINSATNVTADFAFTAKSLTQSAGTGNTWFQGPVNTTGLADSAGGVVDITTNGNIDFDDTITTSGGTASAGNTGRAGGAVTLTSIGPNGNIDVDEAITTTGSNGNDGGAAQPGGAGGAVTIDAQDGSVNVYTITTEGGDADNTPSGGNANGGAAGAVTITSDTADAAKTTTLEGDISAVGGAGAGVGGSQGAGGNVTLNSQTVLNPRVGTDIAIDTGATAGTIAFGDTLDGTTAHAESLTLTAGTGDIDFDGVVGGITALGDVLINSATNVTADFAFTAKSVTQGAGTSDTWFQGTITTKGAVGADGGDVRITTAGNITIDDKIDATGGDASSPGNDGGDVILDGDTVTVDEIDTSGSDADGGSGDGGNAGMIDIIATTKIILTDNLTAKGGAGAGSDTRGNGGDVTLVDNTELDADNATTPIVIDTSGDTAGNINFGATDDTITLNGTDALGDDLTLTAGDGATTTFGDILFSGVAGGTTALGDVIITNAEDVDLDAAFAAKSFTQTDGSGTTTLDGLLSTTEDVSITTGAITFANAGAINAAAGTGTVILNAQTGAITENTPTENANIIGASAVLTAVTGIGASDIETEVTTISADTTNGGIDIHNTHSSDVTVTSLGAIGDGGYIRFIQDGGGDLVLTDAASRNIWIQVDDNADLRAIGGTISAGDTYDPTVNDDRAMINFLDEPRWGLDPGDPIDVAVYLASTGGNVTVGSPVTIADNGALVIDAADTVTFQGTFETGSDFDWLEACSRITETLREGLNEATLPYVDEFSNGINPFVFDTVYVLRGGEPDAWVLNWTLPVMEQPPIAFDLMAFGPERIDDPNVPERVEADLENAYLHSTDVLAPSQP